MNTATWLSQNLLTILSFVASLIAAVAAIIAARASLAQAHAMHRQNERRLPIITCELVSRPVSGNWHKVSVVVRNLAEASLKLNAVSVVQPRRIRLLPMEAVYGWQGGNYEKLREPQLRDAATEVALGLTVSYAGSPAPLHGGYTGAVARTEFLAYLSEPAGLFSLFSRRRSCLVISFSLSWSDASAESFRLSQKIPISVTTSNDSP